MKTILHILPLLILTATLHADPSAADIAKSPFDYEGKIVAIKAQGGEFKQTGSTTWVCEIFPSGITRYLSIVIDSPDGKSAQKYKSPLYCRVGKSTEYKVYLTALGNSKNTSTGGESSYSWKK